MMSLSWESHFLTWLIIVTCFGLMQEVYPQQATQCGVRSTQKRRKRVIGGNIARSNSWPWLVNMIDKDDSRQYCSGVIIDRQWILTAAHCFIFYESNSSVATLPLTKYKYVVADHRYNVSDPYEYTVEASLLFIHPKYQLADNTQPGDYDIALIKLKTPLQFSKQVKQACLPTKDTIFNSTTSCYLAGWGNTVNTEQYHRSSTLKEVKLKLVSFQDCNSKTAYNGIIPRRFRCAGYAHGGKDGCYGDSGGPLQCYVQALGVWTVAGIMSWGKGCGLSNHYGVYTDVQLLWLPFIKPVLKGRVDPLTTYHKRPLCRFKKISKFEQKSFYLLFTKNNIFTDIDLVRNLQLTPFQISLLKNITLVDYAFVMDTSVASLVRRSTRLNQIVARFQQCSKKFENYDKLKMIGRMKNKNVSEIIKMSGMSKAALLNAGNPLKVLKNIQARSNIPVIVNSMSG